MPSKRSERSSWLGTVGFVLLFFAFATALTSSYWFRLNAPTPPATFAAEANSSLYTSTYPSRKQFRRELEELRRSGRLTKKNEALINHSVAAVSEHLEMPRALLWCLLFQESRLNHLEGLENDGNSAIGLGQFSPSSFHEINHQLTRYSDENLEMMKALLGRDVRPVSPLREKLLSPSSYFYIPTAVASSGAYLNNRYLHLKNVLDKRKVHYNPGLLWFYAVIAYNKGGRSVLSLWNSTKRAHGKLGLQNIVSDSKAAFELFTSSEVLRHSLRQIWTADLANPMAAELRIHILNLQGCATAPRFVGMAH